MELRQLRYFEAVCRTGTFRAAAEEQRVAQPALWQQVRAFERETGVRLFERQGRNVRVTVAGLQLLERARNVLESARRFMEHADDLRQGRAGTITIATPAPAVQRALASLIARFRTQNPGIHVVVVESHTAGDPTEGRSPSSVEALRNGAADLAVAGRLADLPGRPLYTVRVVAVGAGGRGKLSITKLRDQPLLVSAHGYFSRTRLERAASAAGFEARVEFESPTPAMLLALAGKGQGIAVIADDAIPENTPRRPIVGIDGEGLSEEAWLHWRAGDASLAVQRFIELL